MTESTTAPTDVGTVPARRRPGRPARGPKANFVRISLNLDPDLYAMIDGIADHVGIPASRVTNSILRAYFEADYSNVSFGFVPGKESNHSVVSLKKWPQSPVINDESQRPDVEGQS